jgi:hypothetical protein
MKRSRYHILLLKAALILQMIHTALSLIIYLQIHLINPLLMGQAGESKFVWAIPDLIKRLQWHYLFFLCAAAIFEIILWRWLSKKKCYVWNCFVIMVSAMSLNILYVTQIKLIQFRDSYFMIAAIIGFIGLWIYREEFAVRRKDMLRISASIVLALFIVYISGRHFPNGAINWAIPVPDYIEIVALSRFNYEESVFMLFLGCYAIVGVCWWVYKSAVRAFSIGD